MENKSVVEESYSYDILIIDKTSGTNIYDIPLLVPSTVDVENKAQIIGFSLLKDITDESFINFNYLLNNTGNVAKLKLMLICIFYNLNYFKICVNLNVMNILNYFKKSCVNLKLMIDIRYWEIDDNILDQRLPSCLIEHDICSQCTINCAI